MEASTDQQGHSDQPQEIDFGEVEVDVNQEDDFDFELDGGDSALNVEMLSTDLDPLTSNAEVVDTFDEAYTHALQGDSVEEAAPDPHETFGDEIGYDNDDLNLNTLAGAADATNDWQYAEQENNDGEVNSADAETRATVDGEDLEDNAHAKPDQGTDIIVTTTSVDYHEQEEEQDFQQEGEYIEAYLDGQDDAIADDKAESIYDGNASLLEGNFELEVAENSEALASTFDSKLDDHGYDNDATFDDQNADNVSDRSALDATLAKTANRSGNDDLHDIDDPALDVENQDEDDEVPSVHPEVAVLYQRTKYSLFAQSPDDDSDHYFFADVDVLDQPLSQFLSNLREVIREDLGPNDELVVGVDKLGIDFGETTTSQFLDQKTFRQIIDVHDRLASVDGHAVPPTLVLHLETRPNCLSKFAALENGVIEGMGLSAFSLTYHLSSDVDEDDITPDDASPDQRHSSVEEWAHQVDPAYNPFRVTDVTQSHAFDVSSFARDTSVGREAEADEREDDLIAENLDEEQQTGMEDFQVEDGRRDQQQEETDRLASFDEQLLNDNSHAVASELAEAEESTMNLGNDDGEYRQEEQPSTTDNEVNLEGGKNEEEEELIDYSDDEAEPQPATEDHTGDNTQGEVDQVLSHDEGDSEDRLQPDFGDIAADDYIDIGVETEVTQAVATNAGSTTELVETAQTRGTPLGASGNSSVTATLSGEEYDATVADDAAGPSHPGYAPVEIESAPVQSEHDEIDWELDDDDDVAQPTTEMSPSSFSAKRSRQTDEGDILGDESDLKRRRI